MLALDTQQSYCEGIQAACGMVDVKGTQAVGLKLWQNPQPRSNAN